MKTVTTLGPKGSFTSQAALVLYPSAKQTYAKAEEGLRQLQQRHIDAAIYPIENNIGGFVHQTFGAIYRTADVHITAMYTLSITQNLIGQASSLEDIEVIQSHPQAIAQCRKNINRLNASRRTPIQIIEVSSTAEGVKAASKDSRIAAIGSAQAAILYNVPILVESFQDKARNETRFARFELKARSHYPKGEYRSMYLIEFHDLTYGLHELTSLLYSQGVTMTSITYHPIYTETPPMHYAYFIEIEGVKFFDKRVAGIHKALVNRHLPSQSRRARWVGSYLV